MRSMKEILKESDKQFVFDWQKMFLKDICATYLVLRAERIVRNGPATIVFWSDGTKTIVKKSADAPDDMYYAFTAAFAKKCFGSNSQIRKIIREKTVWQQKKISKTK